MNLTDRERGEEALRAKETELEMIINCTPFMLIRCTRDLRYQFVSLAYAEMLKRTPEEIVGKSISEIIGAEGLKTISPYIKKVLKGDRAEYEQQVAFLGIGTRYLHSIYTPERDRDANVIGWVASITDITQSKRVESRLAEQARLLDLSNEAILVRDKGDRITYWNDGAAELYGYSAEEALGKVAHKFLRTEHSDSLEKIFATLEREDRWSGEVVHKRKDGTKVVVMSNWALDRDKHGKWALVLETNTDITQRKQVEVALQRSKEMLEKLVQQRTKALRTANAELGNEIVRRKGLEGQILEISDREQERLGQELHDGLCQQLTAIGFFARATALRLKNHRVVEVDDLERIAQLINRSVMDARNIARDLHKEEIDAAEFPSALTDLVDRKIWKTPCRLDLKTKLTLESDTAASQLYRILREAIINANKHAGATETVLTVKRAKNELVFSVSDNGRGFSAKNKGHGLGFHIMKYRAESIGARLELESRKKGGTRVTCYLPMAMTK